MDEFTAADMVNLASHRQSFVKVNDDFIVINVAYEYEIARSRCNTPEKLLGWIVHLCEKTWITPAVLDEFAHKAAEAAGFELNFA